jgi:hypothetical protein
VPFDDAMLEWEAGPRRTDGVWARHWYDAVERSTGFEAYTPKSDGLATSLKPVHEACRIYYDRLYAHRLAA